MNDYETNNSRSAWCKGIDTITSILEPSGDALPVLTEEQKQGLVELRYLLINSATGGLEGHIPLGLLKEFDDNKNDAVAPFLIEGFGGVRRKKKSMKAIVKNTININRFVKGALDSVSRTKKHMYLPAEWKLLSLENKIRLCKMLSWESLSSWNFNILELNEVCGGHPLLFIGWALLISPHAQNLMEASILKCSENDNNTNGIDGDVSIDGEDVSIHTEGYKFDEKFGVTPTALCSFLRSIERDYKDLPYHNRIHAADVVQTLHSIFQMGGKEFADDIHIFSMLIAAIGHDVGHPGKNNAFQVNAKTDVAILYNDQSCLENMHAATMFSRLIGDQRKPEIDIFGGLRPKQLTTVRKLIVEAILHTDMSKHFGTHDRITAMVKNDKYNFSQRNNKSNGTNDTKPSINLDPKDQELLLYFFLHTADISNPAKPSPMFTAWTERCLEEFFLQGDMEKKKGLPISPLCNRETTPKAQSQIGFIQYVILPSYETLSRVIVRMQTEVVPIIRENFEYWKRQQPNQPAKN